MSPRVTVRFVTHRCPLCGAEVGAPASAEIVHRCPKRRRGGPVLQLFKVDAQASEAKGKP